MSYLIVHRYRYPEVGSSAAFGRILSQAEVDNLEGMPIRDAMRPMLRSAAYCIPIVEWVAIIDRIHTYADEGGIAAKFDDGTQLDIINKGD